MNAIEAILEYLLSNPSDLVARLALADCLEERDDHRGELLRIEHALTQQILFPQRAELERRQRALLEAGVKPVGPFLTVSIAEGARMTFSCIPPGTFMMGSPGTEVERNNDEQRHQVTLTRGFFLGVYPVTQGQWKAVVGSNPAWFSRTGGGAPAVENIPDDELERFPVECVSWEEAQEFCRTLTGRTGRRMRLPTEAEWEYACRGGTTTAFYFGSSLDRPRANYLKHPAWSSPASDPDLGRPTPVGTFERGAPHPWGLCDMHGNVSEMCQDWHEDYGALQAIDPVKDGPRPTDRAGWRVERGGSCYDPPERCRAAARHSRSHDHSIGGGFRVCFHLDEGESR
jgi:uncharacterized protein (TIGR02996 family)